MHQCAKSVLRGRLFYADARHRMKRTDNLDFTSATSQSSAPTHLPFQTPILLQNKVSAFSAEDLRQNDSALTCLDLQLPSPVNNCINQICIYFSFLLKIPSEPILIFAIIDPVPGKLAFMQAVTYRRIETALCRSVRCTPY